ncbi:MAG: hypothetical protein ABIH39_01225 [Candidatus Margulisiibacteriota bacterium]
MKNQILVITDKLKSSWTKKAIRSDSDDNHYDVLALGVSGEAVRYENGDDYSRLKSLETIDAGVHSEDAQEKIRQFIPAFIYEFPRKEITPGKTLLDLLRMRGVNLWWFTEMAEKGALRTPFIKRLFYLQMIISITNDKEYNEIWIDCEDRQIEKLLISNNQKLPNIIIASPHCRSGLGIYKLLSRIRNSFWTKLFRNIIIFYLFHFARWIILKISGIEKKDDIPQGSVLFFSFFPYFWLKSHDSGLVENFFRSVPEEVGKWAPVRYAVWLTMRPVQLWRQRVKIKQQFDQQNIFPMEPLLTIRDWTYLKILTFRYICRVVRYRSLYRGKISENYSGFDITGIVLEELDQSLQSSEIVRCLAMMLASAKMTEAGTIIYRLEFQPHERAVLIGARGKCRAVGYQHQAIARNHLQYFFPQAEIEQAYSLLNNPDCVPLSDRYFTAGEYAYDVFINNGFLQNTVSICGPVRYASLVRYLKQGNTKQSVRKKYGYDDNQRIFLVAAPSIREQMLNLIPALLSSIQAAGSDALLLFKSHPVFKFNDEIKTIINEKLPGLQYEFLDDTVNLNDYLLLADAVVLTGTTVGIEAISLGVMPIVFDNSSTFSLNPLLEIRDACLWVRNTLELKNALTAVIDQDNKINLIKKNWPDAIRLMFNNLNDDPNEKFSDILYNRK